MVLDHIPLVLHDLGWVVAILVVMVEGRSDLLESSKLFVPDSTVGERL